MHADRSIRRWAQRRVHRCGYDKNTVARAATPTTETPRGEAHASLSLSPSLESKSKSKSGSKLELKSQSISAGDDSARAAGPGAEQEEETGRREEGEDEDSRRPHGRRRVGSASSSGCMDVSMDSSAFVRLSRASQRLAAEEVRKNDTSRMAFI